MEQMDRAHVEELERAIPVDSRYIGLLLKMTGIAYVAEFATNICKDAGFAALGIGKKEMLWQDGYGKIKKI